MLSVLFATALALGFSGALMPGPLLTAVIVQSVRRGMSGGLWAVAGHALLELILVVLLVTGVLTAINEPMLQFIYIGGGLVLLWMAKGMLSYGMKVSKSSTTICNNGDSDVVLNHPFLSGLITTASNPYWYIWWATVGAGYLLIALTAGPFGVVAFYIGHVLADLIWYGAVSAAITRGRSVFSPRVYSGLLFICSIFLAGVGAWFVITGIT